MSKKQKPWAVRQEIERQAREQRRRAAQIVLDKLAQGPYRGFLMIQCPECGEIDGYNARRPTYSIHCRTCGAEAALEHLRPLHINCACGARWTYLTNVQANEWRVRCIRCQAVNVARMGRRGTAYIATPEKED